MGYTHYWSFKSSHGNTDKVEKQYQLAIKQCNKIIKGYNRQFEKGDDKRLSGYSAHASKYSGIHFNGVKDNGHEDFCLRAHYNQNDPRNFCKTARKPYDEVVVACLVILKHYLKDYIEVGSDGESVDFWEGCLLVQNVTRLKGLINPISGKGLLYAV